MFFLLYWAQNLIGADWTWFRVVKPFLISLVSAGEHISNNSITFFETSFEIKYFIVTIAMLLIYYIVLLINKFITFCREMYCDGRCRIKKVHEGIFNKHLENSVKKVQRKIDKYQIYLTTQPKCNYVANSEINLSEENKQLNKFLIEKTGVVPSVIRNGFLYSFDNMEQIDNILVHFFKVLHSEAPLDYCICVYLVSDNRNITQKNLEKLVDLNIKNKIITLSDVSLRYSYNAIHNYDTSIVGIFQKANETFEVHQFTEKIS